MISFDKIVNKLSQRSGSILLLEDIFEIVDPTGARTESTAQVNKLVYRLVHSGHLMRIRNGVYLVGYDPLIQKLPQFITTRYWEIVVAFVRQECGVGQAIIGGLKALELHMGNTAPVEHLQIFVPMGVLSRSSKLLRISSQYTVTFKSISLGGKSRKEAKDPDLFIYLKAQSSYHHLPGVTNKSLRSLSPECAILDTLLEVDPQDREISRFLDIWTPSLERIHLGELVSRRYITSINRLRELAQIRGDDALYATCVSIIRDEGGGCFITGKEFTRR